MADEEEVADWRDGGILEGRRGVESPEAFGSVEKSGEGKGREIGRGKRVSG